MSIVVMLMIFGWSAFFAMIAFYALKESGKLLRLRRSVALWLDDTLVPAIENGGNENEARELASGQ
jgi:hypothetical protein